MWCLHLQELSILQDLDDARGECRAHGNLGAVHLSLANYINAMKCYQEQLEKAMEVKEPFLEATGMYTFFKKLKMTQIDKNVISKVQKRPK